MPLKRKLPSKITQEDVLKRDVYVDDVPQLAEETDDITTPEALTSEAQAEDTTAEQPVRRRERGAARAQQMSQRVNETTESPETVSRSDEDNQPTQPVMDKLNTMDPDKQAAILSDLKGETKNPAEDVTEAAFISPEEDNILPTPGFSLAREPKPKAGLMEANAPSVPPAPPSAPVSAEEAPTDVSDDSDVSAPKVPPTDSASAAETADDTPEASTESQTAQPEPSAAEETPAVPPATAQPDRPKSPLKRKIPELETEPVPEPPLEPESAPEPPAQEGDIAAEPKPLDVPSPPPVPEVKPSKKPAAEEELPPLAPGWGPPPLPGAPKDPLASPSGYDPLSDSKWSRFAKKEDVLPAPGEPFVPPAGTQPPGEAPTPKQAEATTEKPEAAAPAKPSKDEDTQKPLPPLPDFGKDMFAGGGGFPSFPGGDMFGGGSGRGKNPQIPKPKVYLPADDDDDLPPEPDESEYGATGAPHQHKDGQHTPPELPNGKKKPLSGGGGFRKVLTVAIVLALIVGAVVLIQDGENTQQGRSTFADLQEAPPSQSTASGGMPAPASPIAELDAAALPTSPPTESSADINFVDVSDEEANQPVMADGSEEMPAELGTIAQLQQEIQRLKEQKDQQEDQRLIEEVIPTKQQIQAELDAYREALAQSQSPEELDQARAASKQLAQQQKTTRTTPAPQGLPPGKILENPYNLPTIPEPEENPQSRVRTLEDFELAMFTPERNRVRIPDNIRPRLSATDYPQLDLLSVVPEQGIIAAHKGREGVLLLGESVEGWQLVGVFADYAEFRNGQRKYILRFN